jgi:hypothetical protein
MQFKGLNVYQRRPLNEEETIDMCQAVRLDAGVFSVDENHPSIKVLRMRLDMFNIPASPGVVYFAASLCDRMGKVTMWASEIARIFQKNEKPVTIRDFTEVYPDGVSTEEAYAKAWNDQKYFKDEHSLNFVDTHEAYLWPE